jgi:hypothetical protein
MAEKTKNGFDEFANRLTMFRNGFDAITKNIEGQLKKIDMQIAKMVDNTDSIPKMKDENKEMYKTLQGLVGTLGELTRRLDKLEAK